MKRFKCTVTREDEYIIEIDKNVLDEEWTNHFKRYFYQLDDLQEHAENIAKYRARYGDSVTFIEGYGTPLVNGREPFNPYKDSINNAINIVIINEDENCDVEVEEIKGVKI